MHTDKILGSRDPLPGKSDFGPQISYSYTSARVVPRVDVIHMSVDLQSERARCSRRNDVRGRTDGRTSRGQRALPHLHSRRPNGDRTGRDGTGRGREAGGRS